MLSHANACYHRYMLRCWPIQGQGTGMSTQGSAHAATWPNTSPSIPPPATHPECRAHVYTLPRNATHTLSQRNASLSPFPPSPSSLCTTHLEGRAHVLRAHQRLELLAVHRLVRLWTAGGRRGLAGRTIYRGEGIRRSEGRRCLQLDGEGDAVRHTGSFQGHLTNGRLSCTCPLS